MDTSPQDLTTRKTTGTNRPSGVTSTDLTFEAICKTEGVNAQDAVVLYALATLPLASGHHLLARRAMTTKRTVRRRLRSLEERGLISVTRHAPPRANEYRFAGELAHLNAEKVQPQ